MQVYDIKEGNCNRTFLQYSHISYTKFVSERGISPVFITVPYFPIISSHSFTDFPLFAPLFFMHVLAPRFVRKSPLHVAPKQGVSTFSLPAAVVFYFREDLKTGAVFSASCTFVHAKLLESCLTLCDPMDYSSLGSSLHVILHAKILEWLAIPFSRGSSPPMDQTHVPCVCCTGRQVLCH